MKDIIQFHIEANIYLSECLQKDIADLEEMGADQALIDEKKQRLRECKELQAELMGWVFEQNLTMPIDAGQKALERADEVLEKYGPSPSADDDES